MLNEMEAHNCKDERLGSERFSIMINCAFQRIICVVRWIWKEGSLFVMKNSVTNNREVFSIFVFTQKFKATHMISEKGGEST